jgi:tetratricopeptide (TPR) repeat protein
MDLPSTHYDRPAATTAAVKTETVKSTLLSRISFYLLLIAAFLSPLVFIPSAYAPLDVVKAFFLGFTILGSALLYTIDAVKQKSFTVPKSALGYLALAIVVSTLVSTFTSGNIGKAFIGQGFELSSASFILLMIVAAFLVSRVVIKDREVVFKVYTAIFISFIILALFHVMRFIGGADFLSLGILQAVTSTIAGKWYDFAAIVGSIGLLSLVGIKFLPLRKSLKVILLISSLVCGALLFIVNSAFIWSLIAIVLLTLGVYEYMTTAPKGEGARKITSRISIATLVILVISIGLAWKGNVVALPVVEKLNAQYGELVLPWQMTLDITSGTLKEDPLWGVGPNRFGLQYLKYKPTVINQSPFWTAEFTSGFGLIPTILVTQGIVGGLVWVLFLVFLVREGVRGLRRVNDPVKKFFITSSFFSTLFVWLIALTYVPSHVTIFLTAIFTGILIALLVSEGVIAERVVSFRREVKFTRLVPLALYAAIIVLIVWLGSYAQKAIAITNFQKGIKELSTGKTDAAKSHFMKALSWNASDVFYQALSETNIVKINTLAQEIQAETRTGATPDAKKSEELVALIADSVKYTKKAQEIDPTNYYNYVAEARISEIGTSLQIENAYANAKNAYANAIQNNPYNPALYLNMARLEASQGKLADAQQFIGRALQLKPNYTDAVFFLSQLQVANNQLDDAIVSTQVAIQLNPNEPLLYFQLGLLAYNAKNYTASITALEKAVSLNKDYANAQYFLGLSYARMGRNEDAIKQFEALAITNPDNQEVAFILSNLKEGKSPFADAKPPIDSKPEQRKTLPVTEKTNSSKTTAAKKSS